MKYLIISLLLGFSTTAVSQTAEERNYAGLITLCDTKTKIAMVLFDQRDAKTVDQSLAEFDESWYNVPDEDRPRYHVNVEIQRLIREVYREQGDEKEFIKHVFKDCLYNGF